MAVEPDAELLSGIFGKESSGKSIDDWARSSKREFVRSQDHLAFASDKATGRRLTAWEAYKSFGLKKLEEVLESGSAILASNSNEPSATMQRARQDRGLRIEEIADATGVSVKDIQNAESSHFRNSIQLLEKIAKALGLEESRLGVKASTELDKRFGIRLKQAKDSNPEFTVGVVLAFDEAAWVIQKQLLLNDWLGVRKDIGKLGFEVDSRFGDKTYPAWRIGYDLAHTTRKNLGIATGEPISNLRDIVEVRLKIPLIHLLLPRSFAGATIAVGSARGIAVNTQGSNTNEWVRRATIAHELGHLLWDPDERLNSLVVDTFKDLEEQPQLKHDFVEARANAFAIEFLAPQDYALKEFKSAPDIASGLRKVMVRFGVSFTSAKFQIWNAVDRSIELEKFSVDDVEPTDDWKGRESSTLDYFKPPEAPISRRGYFAYYVAQAFEKNLISAESASVFLGCAKETFLQNVQMIRSLFGSKE